MYQELKKINIKPEPFEFYTAESLWADTHTSGKMLNYHLNENLDMASRNKNFINKSANWIVSEFSITKGSKICDFGCGPGLYTSALAKTGAIVTGIDFSMHSLEYAKSYAENEKLEITYIHKNYLDYETDEKYDLIIMIMCDFSALSPQQRKTLLDKFHDLLKDDGSILLDVYSIKGFEQREENCIYEHKQLDGFWSPDDYYGFLNTFKYVNEKVVLDKYTIIEEKKSKVIYNWLQYFSEDTLKDEFENSGFKVKAVYDDVAGTEYSGEHTEFAVVAVKK